MGHLKDLKPVEQRRVFDLVQEAGLDVTDWGSYSRGSKWAAANPKYCYEWAFIEPGRLVVLNLWHADLRARQKTVVWSGNPREWSRWNSRPGATAVRQKRAEAFENAIREAARGSLTVRVIVMAGKRRNPKDPAAKASTVERRLLDPLPWGVTSYDRRTGQCTVTRGVLARGSVDQFDLAEDGIATAERVSVHGTAFVRDPLLRSAALQRAQGKCEFCLGAGFTTADGKVFLETHHVIPLSEGGTDSAGNVAAICPNHHREAHYGSGAKLIREALLKRLRRAARMRAI